MSIILSSLALATGTIGALFFLLIALLPQIGPHTVLQGERWKIFLAALSIGLATLNYLQTTPSKNSHLVVLILTVLLALLNRRLYPQRIFVALRNPTRRKPQEADLGDNAPVIGFAQNGEACAWALEMVVPHHLIETKVGGQPILLAY